jgi:hypothetical protein
MSRAAHVGKLVTHALPDSWTMHTLRHGVMQALRRMADPAPLDKARSEVLRQVAIREHDLLPPNPGRRGRLC